MVHPHDIRASAEPWTVRIVYLAKEMAKAGHKVKLVYFPLEGSGGEEYSLESGITAVPFNRRHGLGVMAENTLRLARLGRWADVIHIQKCFHYASFPCVISSIMNRKPLHYDWDDWELKIYEVSTRPGGLLRGYIRFFIGFLEYALPIISDSVSVASARLKEECRKLGVAEDKIFDAHVGADLERFFPFLDGGAVIRRYGIDKPIVLYLGQLHGGQYVELFIKAASIFIREYGKDAIFMIVGDGYMAEELKKKAFGLGLGESIIFAGSVAHEAVPSYIAAASVCVACFEDNDVTRCKSPLKIVEYLASGKAIVASRVGEVENMIADAGILVPPGDCESLAEGINRLLKDAELRKRLQEAARKRAEQEYNWGVTANNIMKAYSLSAEI